jgi:hypothetical protein
MFETEDVRKIETNFMFKKEFFPPKIAYLMKRNGKKKWYSQAGHTWQCSGGAQMMTFA